MVRFFYWLDLAFGTALMVAVAGLLASLWPAGAAQAAPVAESRPLGGFDAIASAGSWDLNVRAGSAAAVRISAEPGVAAAIETVVEGSTLQIRLRRPDTPLPHGKVRVDVSLPVLRALQLGGAGDARVEATKSQQLRVTLSGAGDVRLAGVDSDRVEFSITGAGDIRAAGTARQLTVTISGSGDLTADDLPADEVTVRIAGSGDVAVRALKTLDASIAGSGSIGYRGNPTVQRRISGSGSVVAR